MDSTPEPPSKAHSDTKTGVQPLKSILAIFETLDFSSFENQLNTEETEKWNKIQKESSGNKTADN